MKQEYLMKIVLAPIVSEKTNLLAEKYNHMTFRVLPSASKREIKAAIELLFGVRVISVRTSVCQGKKKRFGKIIGRRRSIKKAYVCLDSKSNLNLESIGS